MIKVFETPSWHSFMFDQLGVDNDKEQRENDKKERNVTFENTFIKPFVGNL